MNVKITDLRPVLVEVLSECCNEILEKDGEVLVKTHFFKNDEWLYKYKCKKCGKIFESKKPIVLRRIGFKNEKTGENFLVQGYNCSGFPI